MKFQWGKGLEGGWVCRDDMIHDLLMLNVLYKFPCINNLFKNVKIYFLAISLIEKGEITDKECEGAYVSGYF